MRIGETCEACDRRPAIGGSGRRFTTKRQRIAVPAGRGGLRAVGTSFASSSRQGSPVHRILNHILTCLRVFLATAAVCLAATPALAQVHLQALGGDTNAAANAPFYAGALGVKVGFIEVDAEVGRFHNVLPKGVLDAIGRLEQQHNLPVQVVASVPATYGLLSVRLMAPTGPIQPFVGGGVGVARLEPRLNVTVEGVTLGDVFGLTAFHPQTKPMAAALAGLRGDFGPVEVEGGYRYVVIFSKFHPSISTTGGDILTGLNSVYAGLGIRF